MADEPEVIRQQMEETRSNLTQKLEALEGQVTDTVKATTETVSETVEAVKETVNNVKDAVEGTVSNVTEAVQDTVHSVGEAFNIRLQAERRPWLVFAGSVAVGALAAQLLPRATTRSSGAAWEGTEAESSQPYAGSSSGEDGRRWMAAPEPATSSQESSNGGVMGWLGEHLSHFKGLAVGTLMGVVRDMVSKALPESLKDKVTEEFDHFTSALGGEPIRGPVLGDQAGGGSQGEGGSSHAGVPAHSGSSF